MQRVLNSSGWALCLLLASAAVPGHAVEQTSELTVGARVTLKRGTVLKFGGITIDARSDVFSKNSVWKTLQTFRVTRVRANSVWLESENDGLQGWAPASDVVTLEQAIADFTSLIRANPDDSMSLDCRGAIRLITNDMDGAIQDFDAAIRLDPRNKLALADRARTWYHKGDNARSLADLDAVIALDPRCSGAFSNRGLIHCDRSDWTAAMSDLNRAIELNPENSAALGLRGALWLFLHKDHSRARVDLDQAIRINPRSANAFATRGAVWTAKGDFDKALRDYDQAILLEPTNAAALGSRGGLLFAVKSEYEQALSDLDKAIRIAPSSVNLSNRGGLWLKKGDYTKALADLDRAIQLDPREAMPFCNRGEVWRQKKEYDRALADFTVATRIDPRCAMAYHHIAWLCATCPDPKYRDGRRAVELATLANRLVEETMPNVLEAVAAAYAETGDFDTAVRFQDRALRMMQGRESKYLEECDRRLDSYRARKPYRDHGRVNP